MFFHWQNKFTNGIKSSTIPSEKGFRDVIDATLHCSIQRTGVGIENRGRWRELTTAFLDCGLENIEFESGSDFRRHDNFVLSSDRRGLVRYFEHDSEVRIPDTVRQINESSFANRYSVRRVTFGLNSRLERLEFEVFPPRDPRRTLGQPEVVWGPSGSQFARLRAINVERYEAFTSLESIVLSSTLKFIGERCFSGCDRLVEVIFRADSRPRHL
jgi:hypothetical protein